MNRIIMTSPSPLCSEIIFTPEGHALFCTDHAVYIDKNHNLISLYTFLNGQSPLTYTDSARVAASFSYSPPCFMDGNIIFGYQTKSETVILCCNTCGFIQWEKTFYEVNGIAITGISDNISILIYHDSLGQQWVTGMSEKGDILWRSKIKPLRQEVIFALKHSVLYLCEIENRAVVIQVNRDGSQSDILDLFNPVDGSIYYSYSVQIKQDKANTLYICVAAPLEHPVYTFQIAEHDQLVFLECIIQAQEDSHTVTSHITPYPDGKTYLQQAYFMQKTNCNIVKSLSRVDRLTKKQNQMIFEENGREGKLTVGGQAPIITELGMIVSLWGSRNNAKYLGTQKDGTWELKSMPGAFYITSDGNRVFVFRLFKAGIQILEL